MGVDERSLEALALRLGIAQVTEMVWVLHPRPESSSQTPLCIEQDEGDEAMFIFRQRLEVKVPFP
jgi:hypothetical protein